MSNTTDQIFFLKTFLFILSAENAAPQPGSQSPPAVQRECKKRRLPQSLRIALTLQPSIGPTLPVTGLLAHTIASNPKLPTATHRCTYPSCGICQWPDAPSGELFFGQKAPSCRCKQIPLGSHLDTKSLGIPGLGIQE